MTATSTYEEGLVIDALLAERGGRGRIRALGDEDLHRAALALWRTVALWEDALAEYGPVDGVTWLLAVGVARGVLADEESRRERARHRGVPRDAASGMVPPDAIAAIKRRTDLSELIQRWGLTDLRAVGAGKFVGKCPFHEDGSPSFYVYTSDPDDQHWHCFGCQKHGDVFALAREHGAWLSFRDAAEGLASAAGVNWPPPPPPAPGQTLRPPDYLRQGHGV